MNTYLLADLFPHKNIDLRPLKKFERSMLTNEHLQQKMIFRHPRRQIQIQQKMIFRHPRRQIQIQQKFIFRHARRQIQI
jgi:hypothetical protein